MPTEKPCTPRRVITDAQEQAYRMCHHDFMGLSIIGAAIHLGWTKRKIRRLLAELERIAPHLFPILTPRQLSVRDMYNEGHTNAQIAAVLGVSKRTVSSLLSTLRKKKVLSTPHAVSVCSYDSSMDTSVKEKF